MRIVVDMNHPAHVHYFRYFIQEMKKKGHDVLITASEKDVTLRLLDGYNLSYKDVGSYGNSIEKKLINIPIMDFRYYRLMRIFKPDILIGFGSIRAAHASFLLKKPCINFTDTEHSTEQMMLYRPFVKVICTPKCFCHDLGAKHIRFNGYMELASLHPNRFTPDPSVLNELDLTEKDPFIIVRFVSWKASHDIGQFGIRDKVRFVKTLERYGRVLITSEGVLPDELKTYQIKISPEKIHNFLYYATLYIGEGATMASEAAILGTPSIFVSSLVGTMGNFIELEETYDVLYSYTDDSKALRKAIDILENPTSKKEWMAKRRRLINDTIDLTAFMVWFVEKYPGSFEEMKKNPDAQYCFSSNLGDDLIK